MTRLLAAITTVLLVGAGAAQAGAPQAGGGGSVEVAAVWSGTEQKNFKKVLDRFSKKTGTSVTYTSTSDDIASVLEPRISGGEPPDVAILPQPGLLRDFARNGSLKPIEDVAGAQVDKNYAPIWRELGSVDGQLYGVWFKGANKSLVWYNTKVFRDAGVKPADTYDQLVTDLQTVSDFGVTPLAVGAANGWTLTDIFENIYLAQAGPDLYDQLTRHEIPWTHDSVKQALRTMAQLLNPQFLAGGTTEALQTEFPQSVQNLFAKPPKGAVTIEADFVAGTIEGDTSATVGKDAKFFPFPAIGTGEAPVVTGGDVAVLFTDSEAAKSLIRFLATPAAASAWASAGGYISANKNVPPSAYREPTFRRIADLLTSSTNVRFDMSDQQPSAFGATDGQGEWQIFQNFLSNTSDVDGIAQQLETAASQAYASAG